MEAKTYMYDIYLFFAPANMSVPGTLAVTYVSPNTCINQSTAP